LQKICLQYNVPRHTCPNMHKSSYWWSCVSWFSTIRSRTGAIFSPTLVVIKSYRTAMTKGCKKPAFNIMFPGILVQMKKLNKPAVVFPRYFYIKRRSFSWAISWYYPILGGPPFFYKEDQNTWKIRIVFRRKIILSALFSPEMTFLHSSKI